MNGQTFQIGYVPLIGGAVAEYHPNSVAYYRHPDWLGSARLESSPTRRVLYDGAYGPFGEPYAPSGTSDLSFTGMNQDTSANLYDFPAREYVSTQGRWPSPDPAGLAAVDPTNPQSWNRYAYVGNSPLIYVDPTGLCGGLYDPGGEDCMGMFPGSGAPNGTNRDCTNEGCTFNSLPDCTTTESCSITVTATPLPPLPGPCYSIYDSDGQLVGNTCSTGGGGGNGGGGNNNSGNGSGGILSQIKSGVCSALPSGRATSVSVAAGGIGSVSGSLDMVVNYNSGQTSLFATGGGGLGWNGGGSLTVTTGLVFGLNGTNNGFSGQFKGANFYAPTPIPGVGAGGSITHGGGVTVVSAGVSGALAGKYGFGGSWTNTTSPLNAGRFAGFALLDYLGYLLRRPCN